MHNNELWTKAVAFHGHICPGIVVGYRASTKVLELLGLSGKLIGDTHNAIVENDVCGVDGVQIVTGCTLGNDSLIIENHGKFAFAWVDKKTRAGFRLLLKVPLWKTNEPLELHQKVKLGTATPEEKQSFISIRGQRGQELMELSDDELFKVEAIARKVPGKPRLHPFVKCAQCEESFMEPWAQTIEGKILCPVCRN
ncbi:MAG: FmdE family protein [Syntrophomonas sp.]|nr:FmdE family protein [Syntrophomonas sp.]